MDRPQLQRHLAMAERHVAEGLDRIQRQEALIADLRRAGHAAAEACELLETMYLTQSQHEYHRDRLLQELG